ncbi:MAG: hypothetical protein AB1894_18655 [Chloroflexota bacterium]
MDLITTDQAFLPVSEQMQPEKSSEMSRLLNAALIDRQFCDLLLTHPELALSKGYNGEAFLLSFRDRQFILRARFASLTDFAERWLAFDRRGSSQSVRNR